MEWNGMESSGKKTDLFEGNLGIFFAVDIYNARKSNS